MLSRWPLWILGLTLLTLLWLTYRYGLDPATLGTGLIWIPSQGL